MKIYANNPRTIEEEELQNLENWMKEFGDLSGIVHDLNSDQLVGGNQRSKIVDINEAEIEIVEVFDEPTAQGTTALGYVLFAGEKFTYRQVRWTPEKCERANLIANKAGGDWDYLALAEFFDPAVLAGVGFDEDFLRRSEEGLLQLAAMLDQKPDPVEAVPFADYGTAPPPDDGFIPFRFGDYAGRVDPEIYEAFKEIFEEARAVVDSPMLSDVLRSVFNV